MSDETQPQGNHNSDREDGVDALHAQSGGATRLSQPQTAELPAALPTAILQPRRRVSWAWIIPLLALMFTGWLLYNAWMQRGVAITVQLDAGHGLKAGDDVRYRGITVGHVDRVELAPDLQSVIVTARLTSQADKLARGGSRFWVVRPQVRLTQIAGLETLIGPRYLAVLPGGITSPDGSSITPLSPPQRHFIGLPEPPVVDSLQPGDLEIILHAQQRGSLHPGAPVTYRQTRIGNVLSVGLTGDGGAIEARVHISQPYAQLIRPNTRFWDAGGLQATLGITGLTVDIQSAEALLIGGVALATPPPDQHGGEVVRTGHRFTLHRKPEDQWLQWEPAVAIGHRGALLPPGAAIPVPLRATIGWKQGRLGGLLTHGASRSGWVLQTAQGLLGPADLLKPDEKAKPETVVLEVAGTVIAMEQPVWEHNGLAMIDARIQGLSEVAIWRDDTVALEPQNRGEAGASSNHRSATSSDDPPDCLAIADPTGAPLPLAAARLTPDDRGGWSIDPAVPIDASWHGACVLSRVDGKLLGMLLVETDRARVARFRGSHD